MKTKQVPLVLLTFVLAAILFSCKPKPTETPAVETKINGRISEKKTSNPINGAIVSTTPATSSVTTDGNGNYINSEADALNSRTQSLRDYYNDQANTYNNISLACFIAAAAVYVYNIVDAVTTEGEKVYVYDVRDQQFVANQIFYPQQMRLLSVKIQF